MKDALTRREVLVTLGVSAAALAAGGTLMAAEDATPTPPKVVPAGKHEVVPLPFDATKLLGISEKMITSHWQNNYGGALRNLNAVEEQLAAVTKDTLGFTACVPRCEAGLATTRASASGLGWVRSARVLPSGGQARPRASHGWDAGGRLVVDGASRPARAVERSVMRPRLRRRRDRLRPVGEHFWPGSGFDRGRGALH